MFPKYQILQILSEIIKVFKLKGKVQTDDIKVL